ncbi:hypothetical protein AURDEDRAFT_171317 [Auricularia subglabra TFB-10046 SS5]|nr:hypothetical protein AURDEDRAFT_171317 [Auricularia subglabra TFB-10046 SS5]
MVPLLTALATQQLRLLCQRESLVAVFLSNVSPHEEGSLLLTFYQSSLKRLSMEHDPYTSVVCFNDCRGWEIFADLSDGVHLNCIRREDFLIVEGTDRTARTRRIGLSWNNDNVLAKIIQADRLRIKSIVRLSLTLSTWAHLAADRCWPSVTQLDVTPDIPSDCLAPTQRAFPRSRSCTSSVRPMRFRSATRARETLQGFSAQWA